MLLAPFIMLRVHRAIRRGIRKNNTRGRCPLIYVVSIFSRCVAGYVSRASFTTSPAREKTREHDDRTAVDIGLGLGLIPFGEACALQRTTTTTMTNWTNWTRKLSVRGGFRTSRETSIYYIERHRPCLSGFFPSIFFFSFRSHPRPSATYGQSNAVVPYSNSKLLNASRYKM